MQAETSQLEAAASAFSALLSRQSLPDEQMQALHQQIQQGLQSIVSFFQKISNLSYQTEQTLLSKVPYSTRSQSGFYTSGSVSGTPSSLLSGRKLEASGTIGYVLGSCSSVLAGEYGSLSARVNALEVRATGKAGIVPSSKTQPLPSAYVSAEVAGALLSAGIQVQANAGPIRLSGSANGEVGAVYAKATADLSSQGVDFDAAVGVAAARGECTCALNVLGIGVVLSASGSIGSMEAGLSYRQKNREWEFGSKLGFIAGLGFRLKITW